MQVAIPSTKIVTKIEANPLLVSRENEYRQLRVAAYCRVSTDSDEQLDSYEAQLAYYTDAIAKNPKWRFAGIYADEEEDDSGVTSDKTMEELFNPDNYEKVKDKENTYKQKKDVTFDNFEDVTITIEEDSCTIEMMSTDEGYGVKLVISKIGEIELTLPTVE